MGISKSVLYASKNAVFRRFSRLFLFSGYKTATEKAVVKQDVIAEVPIGEFGKIGFNLNQIARHYNGGGKRSVAMYAKTMCVASKVWSGAEDGKLESFQGVYNENNLTSHE